MAISALTVSTIAPYAVGAEELTKTDVNTEADLTKENVIDPASTTSEDTVQIQLPDFKETYNITINFKNEKKSDKSVADQYIEDQAILGITADGKKYVQMTVPKSYKGWITDFKSTVNGELKNSIKEEKEDGTTVYTFELESFETTDAWIKVDIAAINYHHDYKIHLDFKNIYKEYIPSNLSDAGVLQPGNYKFGYNVKTSGSTLTAQAFTISSSSKLGTYIKPEITVDENQNQIVTFYVNRDRTTSAKYTNFKFTQGEQQLEAKVTQSLTSQTGVEYAQVIQVKVPNFKVPINVAYNSGSTKLNYNFTFDASTLEKVNQITPAFADPSTLQDGRYEVEISDYIVNNKTYEYVKSASTKNSVAPKAILEVIGNKYFITATFKGVYDGNPEKSTVLRNVNIKRDFWNSITNTNKIVSSNNATQETVVTFEVSNPFNYYNAYTYNWLYEAKEPRNASGDNLYLLLDPSTLKRIGDAEYSVEPGNYSSKVRYQNVSTEADVTTYISVLGQNAAIDIASDDTVYVTIPYTENEESTHTLEDFKSDITFEKLQDENGNLYALKFEIPNIDTIVPISFTSIKKETAETKSENLFINFDDLALEKLDQPLTFSYKPTSKFEGTIEDGEYAVDVKAFTGTTITSIDTATISTSIDFENMKLTVKDGKKVLSGTVKNKSSWLYPKNFKIETVYGSFKYKDTTVLKEMDLENEIYNQDISMEIEDIGVPQRIVYETYTMDEHKSSGKSTQRFYVDPTSLKPYEQVAEQETITYKLSAAGTGEMDQFIAEYLNPYFGKPAQIKEENGVQYAYIKLTGKMYIAEDIRIVQKDNNTEVKVEVVEDNGKEKMDRERVIKFPIHSSTMKMYVDGESFGQHYFNIDFNLKEEIPYKVTYAPNQPEAPIDIAEYLNPYFEKPAVIYKENGQNYAEITLTGKMYGAEKLQVVKANGDRVDAEIVADNKKQGLERVFTIKVPLEENVLDLYIKTGTYGEYIMRLTFDKDIKNDEVKKPEPEKTEVVTKPEQLPDNKEIPLNFTFNQPSNDQEISLIVGLQNALEEAKAKKVNVNGKAKIRVTVPLNTLTGFEKVVMLQNGVKVGEWTKPRPVAVASLQAVKLAATTDELVADIDSLEGITFEAYEKATSTEPIKAAVTAVSTNAENIVKPAPSDNGNTTSPGNTSGNDNSSQVTVLKSISHSFTTTEVQAGKYGSVKGDFLQNYLAPYFTNAQFVSVNGTKYIQMTLIEKAYGITSFEGGQFVSSTGSGMDQVRVVRVPAAKTGTYRINAGEYGIHDLTFTFGVTDSDLGGVSTTPTTPAPSDTKPVETKPQVVDVESTGDATIQLAFTEENKEIASIIEKFETAYKDGKYAVKVALKNTSNVQQFIVKQNGKEIAKWSNAQSTARIAALFGAKLAATANELTFDVASLEGITIEAVTEKGSYTAAVQATSKVDEEQTTTPTDDTVNFTISPEPTDEMGPFIVNYLKPYFSNAKEVIIDGKQYIELTLTGKAYGFEAIQYKDAKGKLQDVTVVSKTGEKLEQVRVIRLPLVKDADGYTTIFVDSGDLGYGAYNLLFKFDVEVKNTTPEQPTEVPDENVVKPEEPIVVPEESIDNPFKDIATSEFADDIFALYKAGITTGTSATTYSPAKSMTRAQFAVMIARALDLTTPKTVQFKDVQGKWYAKEVQALADAGIVTGTNATTFNPNKSITRQQAAAMIYRMLTYKGYEATAKASDLNYKDAAKVSAYAKEALAELQAQSIMTGANGYIQAQKNLTRGQMAKVLKRSLELIDFEF